MGRHPLLVSSRYPMEIVWSYYGVHVVFWNTWGSLGVSVGGYGSSGRGGTTFVTLINFRCIY